MTAGGRMMVAAGWSASASAPSHSAVHLLPSEPTPNTLNPWIATSISTLNSLDLDNTCMRGMANTASEERQQRSCIFFCCVFFVV